MSIKLELALTFGLSVVLGTIVFFIRMADSGTQSPELVAAIAFLWAVTGFDVVRKLVGKKGIF